MFKKQTLAILTCLMTIACGDKNRGYLKEPQVDPSRPIKGIATYELNGVSFSTNVREDEIAVPLHGNIFFTPTGEGMFKQTVEFSGAETPHKNWGVTFHSVPRHLELLKVPGPLPANITLPENSIFLGAYKTPSTKTKFKIRNEPLGFVELMKTQKTTTYLAKNGSSAISKEKKYELLQSPLLAKLNRNQNEIYFYTVASPGESHRFIRSMQAGGSAPREYGYPLCSKVVISEPNPNNPNIRNTQEFFCDVEAGNCTELNPYSNQPTQVSVASVLARNHASCDAPFTPEPSIQTEVIGLLYKLDTEKNALKLIPEQASETVNTDLLTQVIVLPEPEFIFLK